MAARGMAHWPWQGNDVDALPPAERLVLDAIRRWHYAARTRRPCVPELRLLLAAEGAGAVAPALDTLLRLAPSAGIGCGFCPRVTPDEAALLLLCALAQRGARCEALAAALRILPLDAAQAALPAAVTVGTGLRQAGQLLRHPLREAIRSPAAPRG